MQLYSDNEKQDFITVEGNIYTHKQIEKRDGLIFMRMKKRFVNLNSNKI